MVGSFHTHYESLNMKQRRGTTPRSQPLPFELIHQPLLAQLFGPIEVFQKTDGSGWDIVGGGMTIEAQLSLKC